MFPCSVTARAGTFCLDGLLEQFVDPARAVEQRVLGVEMKVNELSHRGVVSSIVGTCGSARRYYSGVQSRRPTLPLRALVVVLASLGQAGAQAPAEGSGAGAPPLATAWTVPLPDLPAAAPAVDAETAYVVLRGSRLAALALRDGTVTWSVPVADVAVPPETAPGLVLLAHQNELEALDARDGARRWRVPLDGTVAAPLLSQGGWLLAVTDGGRATMLRASTGETLWTQPLGAPSRVRPVAAGRLVYLALQDGRIAALALETGTPTWEAKLPAEGTTLNPIDDRLFVGCERPVPLLPVCGPGQAEMAVADGRNHRRNHRRRRRAGVLRLARQRPAVGQQRPTAISGGNPRCPIARWAGPSSSASCCSCPASPPRCPPSASPTASWLEAWRSAARCPGRRCSCRAARAARPGCW